MYFNKNHCFLSHSLVESLTVNISRGLHLLCVCVCVCVCVRVCARACRCCISWLPRQHGGKRIWLPMCQCRRCNRCRFSPLVGRIRWRRKWQPTPVFLPGKPHRGSWWATVHGVMKSQIQVNTHTWASLSGRFRTFALLIKNWIS